MNFFQQQENARHRTGWLIALFILAVVCLIGLTQLLVMFSLPYLHGFTLQNDGLWSRDSWLSLLATTFIITSVVTLASRYKMYQLSAGGSAVASLLGGTLLDRNTTQADERKILNIVEEMAIAAGVSVPPVYILEETSINAFAAGHSHHDVVIGITRGAIQLLTRDELQGVIAHEFSHIFNGDMKINLQLMGWLYGILFIGLVGRFLLNSSNTQRSYTSDNKNRGAGLAFVGIGLIIIGYSGTFFGKLIKAAISRQREFLADASAVQYTRNPEGIAGALKKIGGCASGSFIEHPNAAQASHLFFGDGINVRQSLFATHPPLEDRIHAIDKYWNGQFIAVDASTVEVDRPPIDPDRVHIVDGEVQYTPPPSVLPTAIAAASVAAAMENIGAPQPEHLDEAKQRLASIPESLQKMARETWGASAITHCLIMERDDANTAQQVALLQQHTAGSVASLCIRIADDIKQLPYALRLPLLNLCLPSLKLLSTPQRDQFFSAVMTQINADQHVSLFEWALYRILRQQLSPPKISGSQISLTAAHDSCRTVLSALSLASHTPETADTFFQIAWQPLELPATTCNQQVLSNISELDKAVQHLQRLPPLVKPRLLKACCAAIADDKKQFSAEAIELLRAIADTLDTPIPPIAMQQTQAA